MSLPEDTTLLLDEARKGTPGATDRLMPRLYDELRRLAHRELARHSDGDTLRTTGLVHEAYIKLFDGSRVEVETRAHFLAIAATTMRHIVIDFARERATRKRGGGWRRVGLDEAMPGSTGNLNDLIDLHDALERLGRFDERLCNVVECRVFGGLTVDETASALGISPRTVDRAWQRAKAWLYREIHETE